MPEIIDRYLQLATSDDYAGMAACFTDDAVVTDEGHTYHGRDEIRAWREKLAAAFDYTVRVLRTEGEYRVTAQVAGDFPGSPVELTYDFRLRDGLIAELVIG
jgi:ketosteroid isomerase-like protein